MYWMLLLLPCLALHESAHAWTANLLGDCRPRREGRLSMNPLVHVDPIGTVALPVVALLLSHGAFCFAYAKPVNVEPESFKRPMQGTGLVAAAGPLSNLVLGAAAAVAWRFVSTPHILAKGLLYFSLLNLSLAALNMLPLPPLDGSKVMAALLPERVAFPYLEHGAWGLGALAAAAVVLPWTLHVDLLERFFNLTVWPLFRALTGE